MAKTDSTKILWQVQVRLSRKHKWRSRGIYETRADARQRAKDWRTRGFVPKRGWYGVGFGNTRIVRHIRGEKK